MASGSHSAARSSRAPSTIRVAGEHPAAGLPVGAVWRRAFRSPRLPRHALWVAARCRDGASLAYSSCRAVGTASVATRFSAGTRRHACGARWACLLVAGGDEVACARPGRIALSRSAAKCPRPRHVSSVTRGGRPRRRRGAMNGWLLVSAEAGQTPTSQGMIVRARGARSPRSGMRPDRRAEGHGFGDAPNARGSKGRSSRTPARVRKTALRAANDGFAGQGDGWPDGADMVVVPGGSRTAPRAFGRTPTRIALDGARGLSSGSRLPATVEVEQRGPDASHIAA